jgi:hypothetical protein
LVTLSGEFVVGRKRRDVAAAAYHRLLLPSFTNRCEQDDTYCLAVHRGLNSAPLLIEQLPQIAHRTEMAELVRVANCPHRLHDIVGDPEGHRDENLAFGVDQEESGMAINLKISPLQLGSASVVVSRDIPRTIAGSRSASNSSTVESSSSTTETARHSIISV